MRITLALMENHQTVLLPVGEGLYYDLLIDKGQGQKFDRVQCKTGKLKNGAIVFDNYSSTAAGNKKYGDKVDFYGVFCPQNGKSYLVPSNECANSKTCLRVEPAKNGMKKNIRLAKAFEL